MNTETLVECLEQPSRLFQINYQELKSLVLQYPYFANLRYLLLQKALQSGQKDLDKLISMAALYSLDRTFLYEMVEAGVPEPGQAAESVVAEEDYLHLPRLNFSMENGGEEENKEDAPAPSGIQALVDVPEPGESEENTHSKTNFSALEALFSEDEEDVFTFLEENDMETNGKNTTLWETLNTFFPEGEILFEGKASRAGKLAANSVRASATWYRRNAVDLEGEIPKDKKRDAGVFDPGRNRPAPLPKDSFESWKNMEPIPSFRLGTLRKPRYAPDEAGVSDKVPKTKFARSIAMQSVSEKEDIASETLAELLVRQGNNKKAIEMYQRLSLLFPDKSSFFADRIEQLIK